jgi:hypothetical protein
MLDRRTSRAVAATRRLRQQDSESRSAIAGFAKLALLTMISLVVLLMIEVTATAGEPTKPHWQCTIQPVE